MPFDLKKVLDERKGENFSLHSKYINPQLPKILGQIEFDRFYEKGEGCYLIDDKGDRYLDLLSGFGVFALGRSHPTIVRALHDALDADLPNLVQMDCSLLSGVLAEQLVARSHPGIERVFFTNSGAEAVESAIKFARAATKRTRILYCDHAFHGLTTGALALNGGREFRSGFGPLLPGADMIPFGDAAALARELRRGDVAAFIAEPIQGKGVNLAPDEFWQEAQSLCRRHKALMILDEVQAGMGRSGTFFCHEQFGITPDIITVSKALSGRVRARRGHAQHGRGLRRRVQLHGQGGGPLLDVQHEPAGDGGGTGHLGRVRRRGHPRPGAAHREGLHQGARTAGRAVRVPPRGAGEGTR